MKLSYMDRDTTFAIKGIALICMFVHHFFTFPGFLIEGIVYPGLQEFADDFCEPMKICVPVFAFLTGYFYAFCKTRTLRYSLRKITDLYVSYWLIYGIIAVFAVVTGSWKFSLYSAAYELAGIRTTLMVFCWYVLFYAYSMLLLPLLTKADDRAPWEDVLVVLILPVVLSSVLMNREFSEFFRTVFSNIRNWFPCVAVGYLCGKYNIFENVFDKITDRRKSAAARVLLWTVMAVAAMAGRYWWQYLHLGDLEIRQGLYPLKFTADIFYCTIFVYGAARLLQYVKNTVLGTVLKQIGKYSLHMWFFHCIFFNVCRNITQPVLYAPKNPVLVTLWGLLLCYIPSVLIDKLIRPVNKLKNRFL